MIEYLNGFLILDNNVYIFIYIIILCSYILFIHINNNKMEFRFISTIGKTM